MKAHPHTLRTLLIGSLIALSLTGCAPRVNRNTAPSPDPSPNPTASLQPEILDPGPQKACTLEAKICPDGSTVGRTGPNCEFAACPESASTAPNVTPILLPSNK